MLKSLRQWAFFCALMGMSLLQIACQKTTQSSNSSVSGSSSSYNITTAEYSPVVMVVLPNGGGICTGTFISEKAVLTAAHCTLSAGRYSVQAAWGTFSTYTVENLGPGVVDDPNDISLLIFDTAVANRSAGQVYDLGESVNSGDTLRLVGYGCNNLRSRTGAGTKRTGTNQVSSVGDYVDFLSPQNSSNYGVRGIIGPEQAAGSCFGDSGGPALKMVNGEIKVVAVTHAGGTYGDNIISEYVNVANRNDNRNFLSSKNDSYGLGIRGL